MLTITARFTVFGYQFPEVDLTPVLGIVLVAGTLLLVGATTMQ
jgi:hypothetical protein